MWCNDDLWTLFGTWFEISTCSPTHFFYSMNVECTNDSNSTQWTPKEWHWNPSHNRHNKSSSHHYAVESGPPGGCSLCYGQLFRRWNHIRLITQLFCTARYRTIRQLLCMPKDQTPDLCRSRVVYKIPFANFPASYIGQRGRQFHQWIQEHMCSKTGRL